MDSPSRLSEVFRMPLPADLAGGEVCPPADAAAPVCSALLRAHLRWQFQLQTLSRSRRGAGAFPAVRFLTVVGTSHGETGW